MILFLYRWKRPKLEPPSDQGRLTESLLAGLRYVRTAPTVHCVLIRTAVFSVGASSVLALLPIIARPYGASGYGMLLGVFGLGALTGAGLLPRLRVRLSVDGLVAGSNSFVCARDFRRRTHSKFRLAGGYFVCRWNGVDQHCGLPECGRTTHDPELDAGARHFHVPAGTAGRHGGGQRRLGRAGDKIRRADYNALFGSNSDRGAGYGTAFPPDIRSAGNSDFRPQPISFAASLFRGKTTFNLRRNRYALCEVNAWNFCVRMLFRIRSGSNGPCRRQKRLAMRSMRS